MHTTSNNTSNATTVTTTTGTTVHPLTMTVFPACQTRHDIFTPVSSLAMVTTSHKYRSTVKTYVVALSVMIVASPLLLACIEV